jgi:hypothetical protein
MGRYESAAEILPYSSRRGGEYGAGFEPWSIETLVEAQRRECAGETLEEIADAMGLSVADVRERLQPAGMRRPRPERATVGYSQIKGR